MECRRRTLPLLFFAFFLVLFSSAISFDITKILSQYPEFSTLSDLLTETQLAQQINAGRRRLTLLAVDNDAISSVSGKAVDVQKRILANHVILGYYDTEKFNRLVFSSNPSFLPTLLQASGGQAAANNSGFVVVALVGDGETCFGSGVKGSPIRAPLVREVTKQPYEISVVQISEPIIAPGIDQSSASSSSSAKTPPS